MRVSREKLLRCLESVSAGLATKEVLQQSSCFIFQNGLVTTFNDEVAVQAPSPMPSVEAAIPSKPLLALLSRLKEDDLEVSSEGGKLLLTGKGRRSELNGDTDIALSIEGVGSPEEWVPMHEDFAEAVGIVADCASRDDSSFIYTCVHITPDFVEACDNFQLARYPVKTNLAEPCLVRWHTLNSMRGLGMKDIGVTASWLHFRDPDNGLRLSCRRWVEDYGDLDAVLQVDGATVVLPPGLVEAAKNAEVFTRDTPDSNQVRIDLKAGALRIRGDGASGWHEERKEVAYNGPQMSFLIAPSLVGEIVKRTTECVIEPGQDAETPGRLKIDAGKFIYVACLGQV